MKDRLLIHMSPLPNLELLEPRSENKLYATDNICKAILVVLQKYNLPPYSARLQSYHFMNRNVVGCSISREYLPQIIQIQFTAYLCKKSSFVPLQKFSSNLTRTTFGLVQTEGHEYVSHNTIRPVDNLKFTIQELFEFTVHEMNDSSFIITLKLLSNYLRYRLSRCIGSPAIHR